MIQLKPNEQRAKIAILMLWLVTVITIISFISNIYQFFLIQEIGNGNKQQISQETLEMSDTIQQIIGGLALIIHISCGVTFIQWFRRAYFNLNQLVPNLSHTENWARDAWFVPIICFYRPYRIMKELYEETITLFIKKNISSKLYFNPVLVLAWWVFWITDNILSGIIFRIEIKAKLDTIPEILGFSIAHTVTDVLSLIAGLLVISIIKNYASQESLLYQIPHKEQEQSEIIN